MPFIKIPIHSRNIEVRKKAVKETWKISQEDKKDILKFITDLGLGKVNQGKKITEVRQLKYLDILKTPLEYFNKPTSKLTLKDIEQFEKDLTSNKIKSYKNKPYENSTKADIRRLLKIYFKWKLGDNEKFRKLVGWFDTREQKRTPEYLSEEEIIKLFKKCKTAKERYLIAVLFDTGARAEEFMNIRYEDVQMPKADDNYIKVTLKEEYSKTKGRVIPLFWVYSLDAVRDYIREREIEGIKSNEQIFTDRYDTARQTLHRIGKKALDKSIHFHLFRHSSATYYAPKINRQQLCIRYGWAFSSEMPDIYISRAGMDFKELEDKFSGTKIEELKRELDKNKIKTTEQEETAKGLQMQLSIMESREKEYLQTLLEIKKKFERHIKNLEGLKEAKH